MTQLSDDQAAFLDALGIPQAYVLSHDWGSIVSHKFLRTYPDRVLRAVILDPITPRYGAMRQEYSPEDWHCVFHEYDSALELVSLSRDTRRIYYKHFFGQWSYRRPLLTDEELAIVIDNYLKPGNVHGGFNYDRANPSRDAQPWTPTDYQSSDCPVALLWAENDPAVPPSGAVHLLEFYSNYTLETIPDCGHFVMIKKPEIVLRSVTKSLR